MKNKGQTAMEYLMTYGWAILIIIVVVAALYAMGVFSIKGGVACSPCYSYFAFRDYDTTTSDLYIRNGARSIEVTSVSGNGGTLPVDSAGATICTAAAPCDPGSDMKILDVDTSGGPVDIVINYNDADTQVPHSDTAKIHNK